MQVQELEDLKRLVTAEAGVRPIVGPDMDRLSPTVPSASTVLVESTTTSFDVRDGDMPEQSVSGKGVGTADVVDIASTIAGVGKWQAPDQHSVHI